MSNKLPKTPEPEVDKENCIDWKAIAINQEKVRLSYERQKRKIKIFNIVCIAISIVLSILVIFLVRYCRHNIDKQREYLQSEYETFIEDGVTMTNDGLIYFVAKVRDLAVAPAMVGDNVISGPSTYIYIVDYDDHVFSTKFHPELLLLTDGSYIKVYYKLEYVDEVYIELSDYEIYGNLENEYYLNMEVNGNE